MDISLFNLFLWIVFCALSGIYDGLLYPHIPEKFLRWEGIHIPHKIAFIMRVIVAYGLTESIIHLVAFGLMLPLVHSGFLCETGRVVYGFDRWFLSRLKGYDGNPYVRILAFIVALCVIHFA